MILEFFGYFFIKTPLVFIQWALRYPHIELFCCSELICTVGHQQFDKFFPARSLLKIFLIDTNKFLGSENQDFYVTVTHFELNFLCHS